MGAHSHPPKQHLSVCVCVEGLDDNMIDILLTADVLALQALHHLVGQIDDADGNVVVDGHRAAAGRRRCVCAHDLERRGTGGGGGSEMQLVCGCCCGVFLLGRDDGRGEHTMCVNI